MVTREAAVLCGRPWFDACFQALDPDVVIQWHAAEGSIVSPGQQLCSLRGNARALLSGERCALNFLQTLSGTATVTARHVAAVHGTRAIILDTRKTCSVAAQVRRALRWRIEPSHRVVRRDPDQGNHIAAAGSLTAAVRAARAKHPRLSVEVEVETFAELDEALAAGSDRIMLDEFSLDDMRHAVEHVAGRTPLEASGGVDLETLRAIAQTGVDYISIGALTKHVRAIDLSMRIHTGA